MSRAEGPGAIQKLYSQRWRIWIVAVLAHTIGMFHRAAMAPMADRLMADFSISALAFGSLGAVYFYIYAAMQLPSGVLADTLGPRKTIAAGLLLSTLGSLIMSAAPSFGVAYAGRLVVSFGVSIVWLSVIKVLMGWFRTRDLATMTGLSGSLANLGQVAAATPLALMVMWVGWRMSFVSVGLVSFALALANWFIVRDSPAQVGLPHTAEPDPKDGLQVAPTSPSSDLSLARRFKIVFGNRHLWPLFLLASGTYGAYATLFHNWAVIYLMQIYGVQRDFAANFVLIATIGMMVGFPVAGLLSDRIWKRRRLPAVLFTGLCLTSFLILALWDGGRPPIGMLYPLSFFMGLGTAAMPITFAVIGDVVQPSVRGLASGLINMGFFVGAAIAQPLFGYILDRGWRGQMVAGARVYPLEAFQQGLFLCCGLVALGFLGALLVKETRGREERGAGGQV
ncbi:MAG: MFS transporter [Dehalococcoidia bacterium]